MIHIPKITAPKSIVGTTSMFRDPDFFRIFQREVMTYLAGFPAVSFWHAGCSTGEEIYSTAIMLSQAGMLNNAILYGTDQEEARLEIARTACYDNSLLESYARNYQEIRGKGNLNRFVLPGDFGFQVISKVRERVSFFQHDLLQESSFRQFHCVFCRNVLIYYAGLERSQILKCLDESLRPLGFLCLGRVEELTQMPWRNNYRQVALGYPIYQKIK